jgi:hypothetical protein
MDRIKYVATITQRTSIVTMKNFGVIINNIEIMLENHVIEAILLYQSFM